MNSLIKVFWDQSKRPHYNHENGTNPSAQQVKTLVLPSGWVAIEYDDGVSVNYPPQMIDRIEVHPVEDSDDES